MSNILRTNHKKQNHGFTMVELLLVIIILSILISTAAPRFGQSRDTLSIRQAANQLKEQINYARRLTGYVRQKNKFNY